MRLSMSSKSAASAAAQEKAGAAVAKQGKSLLRASMEEVHADARANAMDLASPLATHDSASSVSSPPSITRRPSVHFGEATEVKAAALSKQATLTRKTSWFRKAKPDPDSSWPPAPPVLRKDLKHSSGILAPPKPLALPKPAMSDQQATEALKDIKMRMMKSPPPPSARLVDDSDTDDASPIAAASPFEIELQRRAKLTVVRSSSITATSSVDGTTLHRSGSFVMAVDSSSLANPDLAKRLSGVVGAKAKANDDDDDWSDSA